MWKVPSNLEGETMAREQTQVNSLQLLKQAIREKRTDRIYVFHGEETFLLQHYLGQLKKMLIDDLTESFNFHKLTIETFDIRTFADSVENLPMMAENTMVVVDEIDLFKLPEDERNKLVEILEDVPEYCTVIFTYETTSWKPDKRLKKLYDAITQNGMVVEFEKQSQRDLISWITRHFAANKKNISPDLCAYLIDITDGTMTSLAGEINKICAYSGADVIKKSDIDAVVEPVLDAVVFNMTNQLSDGNYGAALITLQKLIKMQEEPLLILGAVGANFRKLATARVISDNGKTYTDLMRLCGIRNDYAAKKTMSACRRFSPRFYEKVSELVMETDRKMKTSHDDAERLLELLIIGIAQEAKND